ncbi:hypothetical protein ACHAPT_006258 [Fusarium lateritium]
MGGTKRTLADVLDADDTDDDPLLRVCRQEEITARANEFSELRLDGLPLNLMTSEFKRYLFWHSNHRLEQAKRDGVTLADITIGYECLPTWPTYSWDPREESLHHTIQSRLITHDASSQAGILVREDIIWKSNRKLDEARALGYELKDIRIGEGLLPV